MEKNQRSRMNCVIEKKRAEEVMDHQPKTVRLPFGVNITTDPRYEHVTGERMAIYCESGHDQRYIAPSPPVFSKIRKTLKNHSKVQINFLGKIKCVTDRST